MGAEQAEPSPVVPLRRRKLDQLLIFGCLTFALTSLCFDRLAIMYADLESATGIDAYLARYLILYGKNVDPLVLANPLWLRIMSGISAFVMGPFYLLLARALVKGQSFIRVPALVYAGVMLYSMVVHLGMEIFGDLPPANVPLMVAAYAPYVVFPLALIWRMRTPDPFGSSSRLASEHSSQG